MSRFAKITTPYQDAVTLLVKVQMVHDMIAYNCTLALGDKYEDWLDKHDDLINQLLTMLEGDLEARERKCL